MEKGNVIALDAERLQLKAPRSGDAVSKVKQFLKDHPENAERLSKFMDHLLHDEKWLVACQDICHLNEEQPSKCTWFEIKEEVKAKVEAGQLEKTPEKAESKESKAYQEAKKICKEGRFPLDILGSQDLDKADYMDGFIYEAMKKMSLVLAALHQADDESESLNGYELSGVVTVMHEVWCLNRAAQELYGRLT